MSAAQLAMPWGRERRYLGKRKAPGCLYNLIQWFIRKMGRCWATLEYLAGKLGVSVRTLQRWWSENAASWGVEKRRVEGNRWEFSLAKVSPQDAQTVTPPAAPPLYESNSKSEPARPQPKPVEIPPERIPNEYGRMVPNPVFGKIQGILRSAVRRIRRARNPVAYEQTILRRELGAMQ